jgi:hypothetical protein
MRIQSYQDMLENWSISRYGPGFHGDLRMIECVHDIIKSCDYFIETGTNLGNTLFFVSRNFDIFCYSCEISDATPEYVKYKDNVCFRKETSPQFLMNIVNENPEIVEKKCFFYLDAHSDTQSVWQEEIKFILQSFKNFCIIIDDFNINNILFSHNGYSTKELFSITSNARVKVYSPSYSESTSNFHSLTGWVLVTNRNDLKFINVKEINE